MNGPGISSSEGVLLRIAREGWKFDFFQAVWTLERLLSPERCVGGEGPPGREAIRFRPHLSMGFPPSDLRRITPVADEEGRTSHYLIDSTFLGLYGVSTPLPLDYSVRVIRDAQRRELAVSEEVGARPGSDSEDPYLAHSPLRDFLDLFHHRLISLFYRAWTKYRYDVSFGMTGRDVLTPFLLWCIGTPPTTANQELIGVDSTRLIRYAGTFTQHPKTAAALQGLLTDFFDFIPVRVEQFQERWIAIPSDNLSALGTANSTLGVDCVAGQEVFDMGGAFEIVVGPVDWETYLTFLPVGRRFDEARRLTRLFCQDMLAFGLTVRLKAGEAPEARLTSGPDAARLGYTCWLRTEELGETAVSFPAEV